jgi:glycosyltransferase involved in cell wall biosynthesis
MLSRGRALGRVLEWANAAGYRGADLVVDLGAYMRARIAAKGVAPARCATIPVWIGPEELAPVDRAANDVVRQLGLGGKFVVAYIGNAGIVHDFDAVLAAMATLRHDTRVHFLFVGDGPQRTRIEQFARDERLENVTFHGYMPREKVRSLYSAADAHLVTLRAPFVGIAVPTKLYQAMASGRPVVFVGPQRSESADTLAAASGGVVVDPADGDAVARLVSTLQQWSARPDVAAALGSRAREYVVREHDRDAGCARFERALRAAWGGIPAKAASAPVADAPPRRPTHRAESDASLSTPQ